jgi:murein DD-endopeptidase MepM/ murein hydrolase activator NlpD
MKKYFKSKLSKEKVAKFFDKEGFYIVLFLCVCIVAITAVWVSRTGVKDDQDSGKTPVENNDNNTAVITPGKDTTTTNNTGDKGLPATNGGSSSTEQNNTNTTNKGNTGKTKPVSSVPATINLGAPIKDGMVKENIIRDYSPEELVCFASYNEWRVHWGLDVEAFDKSEVLTAYDGKVTEIKDYNEEGTDSNLGLLGWTITIDHGNGYKTVYANLDKAIKVKVGDKVKKGQVIGTIGRSSMLEAEINNAESNVSHLHFEVLKKGTKAYENVDPKKYLSMGN